MASFNLYITFVIIYSVLQGKAFGQVVLVSGPDCAETNKALEMNCTVENLGGGIVSWVFNGTQASSYCDVAIGFRNRVNITRCEADGQDAYVNIKILNFTDEDEGIWTCQHQGISDGKSYITENGSVCIHGSIKHVPKSIGCKALGTCSRQIGFGSFCAYPKPSVTLYENGKDMTEKVKYYEPNIVCPNENDYKMHPYVDVSVSSVNSYIYQVSYVEHPTLVFHTEEFDVFHEVCGWCIFLIIIAIVIVILVIGILIYCCCCR